MRIDLNQAEVSALMAFTEDRGELSPEDVIHRALRAYLVRAGYMHPGEIDKDTKTDNEN